MPVINLVVNVNGMGVSKGSEGDNSPGSPPTSQMPDSNENVKQVADTEQNEEHSIKDLGMSVYNFFKNKWNNQREYEVGEFHLDYGVFEGVQKLLRLCKFPKCKKYLKYIQGNNTSHFQQSHIWNWASVVSPQKLP